MGGRGHAHDAVRTVLLVRHGQSTWNEAGRWQGHADPSLSALGDRQARAAAARAASFDAIWSSDLVRARRTAELLVGDRTPVRVERRFRERDVGLWSGLTRPEIEARYPGFLADGRRPAGWEADASVAARALEAVRDVAATLPPGRRALVVTHGGLLRAVEQHLGGPARPILNLAGVWLHRAADGFALGERVRLVDLDPDVVGPAPNFTPVE